MGFTSCDGAILNKERIKVKGIFLAVIFNNAHTHWCNYVKCLFVLVFVEYGYCFQIIPVYEYLSLVLAIG